MQSLKEHKVQENIAYPEMNYTSIKPQVYEFEKQESDNLCKVGVKGNQLTAKPLD